MARVEHNAFEREDTDGGRSSASVAATAPPSDRSAVSVWTVGSARRRFSVRVVEGTSQQQLDELADRALATLARLEADER